MIINDEWRLEADELNVVLMRKKSKEHRLSNKNGEDSYECFYYGTIAYALQAMLEKEIKGTGLKDVIVINDRITKIEQDIKKALGNIRKI